MIIRFNVSMLLAATLLLSGVRALGEESKASQTVGRQELLTHLAPDGKRQPVRTANDWAIRRRQILAGMEQAMGELPDRTSLPPPEMQAFEQVAGDGFIRLEITYLAEEGDRVPAFLYLPTGLPAGTRAPAMLALHPTSKLGKRRVAGEGDDEASINRAYAKELAQRGYVVLAPDYPNFGDYCYDYSKSKYASGSMKGVFNHIRGVDLLLTRPEVDPDRIGAIGHSLGGHNAMFLGAFDERIKVVVTSCGWTPAEDYQGGNIGPWAQDCYMPRIRDVFGSDPNRIPFDLDEVAAALAPRGFFSSSPLRDDNFAVAGVKKAEPAIRAVYALFDAADRVEIIYPDCGHDFPPEARRAAYSFIDRVLHHTPARNLP